MKESDALLNFVITGCMVELGIFILLSFALIFVHLFIKWRKKRLTQQENRIKEELLKALKGENFAFPPNWIKGSFQKRALLHILEEFELKLGDELWKKIKTEVINLFLIPTARRYIRSISWEKRNLAIRTYVLSSQKGEERYIRKILSDSAPINRVYAGRAAIRIGTPTILYDFFMTVHEEPPRALYLFRDLVLLADKPVFDWIIEQIKIEKRNNLRLIYLDILFHKHGYKALEFIEQDLKSEFLELRLIAARIMTTYAKDETRILALKDDPSERIRGLVARALPNLMGDQALYELRQFLNDESWWARLQAALALRAMGNSGHVVLKEVKEEDKAFEAVQHALHLPAGISE